MGFGLTLKVEGIQVIFLSCYSTKIYGNGLFKKLEEAKKR